MIAPTTKTKTVGGSKTKAIPKTRKYKRKKRVEVNPPVEIINKSTTVFKIKIVHDSPLGAKPFDPFLRNETIRYKKIKKPKICIV